MAREWMEEAKGGLLKAAGDALRWFLDGGPWAGGRSARLDQVEGLLDLAGQLQGILVPVEPRGEFRRRLHGDLLLAAQEKRPVASEKSRRRGLVVGALIGSVASVTGAVVALVLHVRHRRATHVA